MIYFTHFDRKKPPRGGFLNPSSRTVCKRTPLEAPGKNCSRKNSFLETALSRAKCRLSDNKKNFLRNKFSNNNCTSNPNKQINKILNLLYRVQCIENPAPALPEIIARPSDARPAIVASRFTGVLLCCALCLHISCTLAEPYGVCRCGKNDHAARCSRAPRQLQMRALDLLSSPC